MKYYALLLCALFAYSAKADDASANGNPPSANLPVGWQFPSTHLSPTPSVQGLDCQRVDAGNGSQDKEVQLVYSSTSPVTVQFMYTPRTFLTPFKRPIVHSYAFTGEVRCDDGWPGSYLQIISQTWSWEVGPLFSIQPDKSWHSFSLSANEQDNSKDLFVCLVGPCTLHFRNLKYVEGPALPPAPDEPRTVEVFNPSFANVFANVIWWTNYNREGSDVWTINYPKVTASHFAIVGDVYCDKVPQRTLNLVGNFLPEKRGDPPTCLFVTTESAGLPRAKISSSGDWQPFVFPFDASEAKTRLTNLQLLWSDPHSQDSSTVVYFRNLELVEYPNGFPADWGTIPPAATVVTKQPPSAPATVSTQQETKMTDVKTSPVLVKLKTTSLDWKSFFLGIVATVLAMVAIGSFSYLKWRMAKRAHERELRRIASLDS
jgi:hypothetical protein